MGSPMLIGLGCLLYLSGNKSTAFVPLKGFSLKKPTGGGVLLRYPYWASTSVSKSLMSTTALFIWVHPWGEINQLQNFTKNVREQPFYATRTFCSQTQSCTQRARILQLLIFTGPLIVWSKYLSCTMHQIHIYANEAKWILLQIIDQICKRNMV